MGIKKHIIAAFLVALPLVAGCQQRTDFDACVEYFEKNIKGKTRPPLASSIVGKSPPDIIWARCKSHGG